MIIFHNLIIIQKFIIYQVFIGSALVAAQTTELESLFQTLYETDFVIDATFTKIL